MTKISLNLGEMSVGKPVGRTSACSGGIFDGGRFAIDEPRFGLAQQSCVGLTRRILSDFFGPVRPFEIRRPIG